MGGWTYILRCSDRSLYVGSTSYDDVSKRVMEHNDARYIGYTAFRRPVILVWCSWFDDLREAHETERRIKGWSRAKKEALIAGDDRQLRALSVRRAGRPMPPRPARSKREISNDAQAAGAKFDLIPRRVSKRPHKRTSLSKEEVLTVRQGRLLIAESPRHPEVRPRAQRGGAPKDA